MTRLRWVLVPLCFTLLHEGGLSLADLCASAEGLTWLGQIGRLVLLGVIVPALALEGWAELHLGLGLPHLGLVFLLFCLYTVSGYALCHLVQAARSRPSFSRRALLGGCSLVAAGAFGLSYEKNRLEVQRLRLPLGDLPPKLDGFRVVVVSDLHRGPSTSVRFLRRVVEQVNELRPDVVLLPGDFVSKSSAYFRDIADLLAALNPTVAKLATLGNHDHWEGAPQARSALAQAGVDLLENRAFYLDEFGQPSGEAVKRGLCLAGVDDLWCGEPDLARALADAPPDVPCLLMSHNPDFAEEEAARESGLRVDLQISGHTHGGQVLLPGLGALATGSKFGLKYLYGMAQGPSWPVFTTRGVGTSIVPVRMGARPEVVVFELAAPL